MNLCEVCFVLYSRIEFLDLSICILTWVNGPRRLLSSLPYLHYASPPTLGITWLSHFGHCKFGYRVIAFISIFVSLFCCSNLCWLLSWFVWCIMTSVFIVSPLYCILYFLALSLSFSLFHCLILLKNILR